MNRYGYSSYRGRSSSKTALIGVVVFLVVLLLLAVAAFFFLQRYMVYTDDGQAKLELPFAQSVQETQAPETASPLPAATEEMVVVTALPEELTVQVQTPEPTPPPQVQPLTNALWLLRAHLTEGSWVSEAEKTGANAVCFNLKADDGTLGYVSSLAQAVKYGTTATDGSLNTALAGVRDSELYAIARISCFKDNKVPQRDNTLAIKTNSGYNWRDSSDKRWMNLSNPSARAYVVGVIQEVAQLGFDEILLENSGYPTAGTLSYIKVGEAYDPENLSGPVEEFYREVREVLEGTGVKLSIAVSAEVMVQGSDASGQTIDLVDRYADRIYVPRPEQGGTWETPIAAHRLVYTVPKNTPVSQTESQLILR